jgi:3-isopropylmalate dehydrogenase
MDRVSHPWIYEGVARRAGRVLLLAGDGIGPAIIGEVRRIIEWFIARRGLNLELCESLYVTPSWDTHGAVVSEEAWTAIRAADAILCGTAGSGMCKELGLYANLRPIRTSKQPRGTEALIVRGLAGDADIGAPPAEIERIARVAFELARVRSGSVCAVDEANDRHAATHWSDAVQAVRDSEYPDIDLRHMHVDVAVTQLVVDPRQFDVLLTEKMFRNIESTCADMAGGGISVFPSASLGIATADGRRRGLYQPNYGSSPDLVGKGVADPIGAILSFAMCLQFSIGLPQEARLLRQAVDAAVASGACTSTAAVADAILAELDQLVQFGGEH